MAAPGAHPVDGAGGARTDTQGIGVPTHQLTMTVLMTPNMANFAGNVHGGTILKLAPRTPHEKRRFREALARKSLRREMLARAAAEASSAALTEDAARGATVSPSGGVT
jgi:hypothetical protein